MKHIMCLRKKSTRLYSVQIMTKEAPDEMTTYPLGYALEKYAKQN